MSDIIPGMAESAAQRSAKALEDINRRQAGLPEKLPRGAVEQRKLLIGLTEEIEGTELPLGPVQGVAIPNGHLELAKGARRLLERIAPGELKSEVQARLRLHHCYSIASAIPNRGEDAKIYLAGAFLQPESKRWVLQPEDFDVIMQGRIRGLNTARAFEILQRASTAGLRVGGRTVRLTDELPLHERDIVVSHIKRQLRGTEETASKSLQLADRMAKATFESAVWDTDLKGNNPYAEAIYLQKYRNKRLSSAKDRGPEITISRIFTLGTSYFRSAQTFRESRVPRQFGIGFENQYLFRSADFEHPESITTSDDSNTRLENVLRRNTALEPLDISRMDFTQLKPGDYAGWLTGKVPQILDLKSLILKSSWEPKDLTTDEIEGFIGKFDAADPADVMRLRSEFVLGIFWSILRNPSNAAALRWTSASVHNLRRNLTALFESEGGAVPAFLPKIQMDWIVKKALPEYGIGWFDAEVAKINAFSGLQKRGVEV